MDEVSGIVRPKTVLAKPTDTMKETSEKPTKRQKQDPATGEIVAMDSSPRKLSLSEGTQYAAVSAEATSQSRTSTELSDSAMPSIATPSTAVVDPTRLAGTVDLLQSTKSNGAPTYPEAVSEDYPASPDEIVSIFVKELGPIPSRTPRLIALSQEEIKELEAAFEVSSEGSQDSWPGDWNGTLLLADKDILNPQLKSHDAGTFRQSLIVWAQKSEGNLRILHGLMRYVYHLKKTPDAAKKLLASTDSSSLEAMERTIRRISYDPVVLRQDGWTTRPSASGVGASGGPVHIGTKIRWQNHDAVVIAYVHDPDIGDLWKALWLDGEEFETFDLEAEELADAQRKFERRQKGAGGSSENSSRRSSRFAVSSDFTVDGIEHGIVLGASFSKGARQGVYWPARLAHASEGIGGISQGKRTSSKQKVELVFLAPYWSSSDHAFRGRKVDSLSQSGGFDSAPLLQVESADATAEMIKEYPYKNQKEIDFDELRTAFRFTGLPKGVFSRFVDSHRLAMSLKVYAQSQLRSKVSNTDRASAGLMETHPMSVQAPMFPPVILNLPFSFILSQLPRPTDEKFGRGSSGKGSKERIIQLKLVLDSMKPPECWGGGRKKQKISSSNSVEVQPGSKVVDASNTATMTSNSLATNGDHNKLPLQSFTEELDNLEEALQLSVPQIQMVVKSVEYLLLDLSKVEAAGPDSRKELRKSLFLCWVATKKNGEEVLSSPFIKDNLAVVKQWRQATERVFKKMFTLLSTKDSGDGTSVAISDPRCNEHRTSDGCMERPVRLPAALKGVRLAGVGSSSLGRFVLTVPDHYLDFVEKKLLVRAHSVSYLDRMQTRCSTAPSGDQVVVLTDDSTGKGGEDTHGSTGTWKAAVAGVAAAVAGVDMIFQGECLNVFCATRPPGHHAGRDLHPMKAVSNGFCILNSVACAALYAVSAPSEGGLGLSRVCVLDFDVHHGNGTQDILCSTYDPRFLYVSLHAGGPHINGSNVENGADGGFSSPGGKSPTSGIYPGRCGDTSPHRGVLNIPLGAKVTSHDVGVALLTRVKPAVNEFAPDLVILSAGFDAHKSDPMGLGGLLAEDFATITDTACSLASDSCSGRVLSVLEGGYGVPCCRPQRPIFLPLDSDSQSKTVDLSAVSATATGPSAATDESPSSSGNLFNPDVAGKSTQAAETKERPQPRLIDLGEDLPASMDDQVPYSLQRRLEKCHAEGFVDCVREHVQALLRWNSVHGPRKDPSTSE